MVAETIERLVNDMTKIEAYRILSKMWNDATPEQDEAINIAMDCIEFVDLMPKDMVPVVHGRWIPTDPDSDVRFYCSECETEISTSWDYDSDAMWSFCPYCGARMDGE